MTPPLRLANVPFAIFRFVRIAPQRANKADPSAKHLSLTSHLYPKNNFGKFLTPNFY
ncbi:MAG: hypothetical protein JWQ50_4295 [Caballeronia mineralivorans]|jgi:hypothetical protein|nr:hypothetical protein [Caballeronia mineralivorans]